MGEDAAALARYTEILGLAEDSVNPGRLDDLSAAWAVARRVLELGGCRPVLTGIPVRDLFEVLDAADRWLAATGRRDWRATVVLQRALVHQRLERGSPRSAARQEALAIKTQHPDAPGAHAERLRFQLGRHSP